VKQRDILVITKNGFKIHGITDSLIDRPLWSYRNSSSNEFFSGWGRIFESCWRRRDPL